MINQVEEERRLKRLEDRSVIVEQMAVRQKYKMLLEEEREQENQAMLALMKRYVCGTMYNQIVCVCVCVCVVCMSVYVVFLCLCLCLCLLYAHMKRHVCGTTNSCVYVCGMYVCVCCVSVFVAGVCPYVCDTTKYVVVCTTRVGCTTRPHEAVRVWYNQMYVLGIGACFGN